MLLIVLIIILLLAFGGGGGYYGYQRWNGRRRWNLRAGPDHSGALLRVRRNAYAPLKFGAVWWIEWPTRRRGVTRSENEMRELEHSEGRPQVIEDAPDHFKLQTTEKQQKKFGVAITEVRIVTAIVAGAIYENHGICRPDFGCARYRIAARADSP